MKLFKKHFYIILVVLFSFLPLIFGIFLPQDLSHTHDGLVHLPRVAAYFKALQDGQFPVRWAGDLNYGYGMPLFNFMYQVPYFVASVFLFLGFGLVTSFKLSLSLSYILSGIFMYLFAKEFFNPSADGEKKAFLVTIFYQFAPFRFVELLIRASFGEVYTYTFLPLVLYGLTLFFQKPKYKYFILASVASALLILSHNAISLVFFAVIGLFIVFFSKTRKNFLFGSLAIIAGMALAGFYWIPAIIEHRYTYGDLFMKSLYLSHFPPFVNFFIPNFFNLKSLQTEGISVQIGLLHVLAILLALIILFRKRANINKKIIAYCLLLIAYSFFMMQPVSKVLWENISLLRQFQFPWRFLSVICFATSLIAIIYLYPKIFQNKIVFYLLVGLTIFSTAYYWQPQLGVDKVNEKYYWNFPLNTTYYGETDVIWSAGPAKKYPKKRIEVIGGKATIQNFQKKSNSQIFSINALSNAQVVSHTQYFPGWKVYIDNQPTSIQFQDPNWRGELTFLVPKGDHAARLYFGETPLRLIADLISLATLISIIIFGLFKKIASR